MDKIKAYFKKVKAHLRGIIVVYIIASLYAVYKGVSSNSIVSACDAYTIMGFVCLLIGLILHLFDSNELNATGFVIKRALFKYNKDFDAFMQDEKAKQKNRFNYSLFVSFLLILTSIIMSLFI